MNKTLIFIMISFLSFVGILKADGHKPDIVDTAVAAGSFNTLVKAVTAADLVETLKSKGPFTVFAPSDEAFSALDPNLLADLLKSENKNTIYEGFIKGYRNSLSVNPETKKSLKGLEEGLY